MVKANPLARFGGGRLAMVFAALALAAVIMAMLAPPGPFIVDGGVYLDMARAMAEDGSLAVAGNGGVAGAPALTKHLTHAVGGAVYPQYPSGYALLAAPFYAALGVHGLMLMNALAFVACAWLTFRITMDLFHDEAVSVGAALIFLLAGFASSYAFSIWPHMVSLTGSLGAVFCAIRGARATPRNAAVWFLATGALIGVGVNIRIDTILVFAVLFFWLRLFARPTDRLAPLWLTLGAAPALLLAAWLNHLKFGTFSPISYGPGTGNSSIDAYTPIIVGGGALLGLAWLVNPQAIAAQSVRRFGLTTMLAAGGALALAALMLAWPFVSKTLYGAYVLVINLQAHNAYHQDGVELNAYGQLMFWGYPKKALIQSLPYLPLMLVPLWRFFRGAHVEAVSLCLLAIAAPVAFYSLKQWHGGGSYNMRYFLPALPFIAMLCAVTLREAAALATTVKRQDLLLAAVLAGFGFFAMQTLGRATPALYAPAALYPQWALALTLAVVAGIYLIRPGTATARALLIAGAAALSYSVFLSVDDEASTEKARAEQAAVSKEIAKSIPAGSLVLTQLQILLIDAERGGAHLLYVEDRDIDAATAAIAAFRSAGRCVYFQNSRVADLLAPHLSPGAIDPTPLWAGRERFPADPRLAFFTLSSQSGTCGF